MAWIYHYKHQQTASTLISTPKMAWRVEINSPDGLVDSKTSIKSSIIHIRLTSAIGIAGPLLISRYSFRSLRRSFTNGLRERPIFSMLNVAMAHPTAAELRGITIEIKNGVDNLGSYKSFLTLWLFRYSYAVKSRYIHIGPA